MGIEAAAVGQFILPAIIGATGSAISAIGAGGQDVQGFPNEAQFLMRQLSGTLQSELGQAVQQRNAPIEIPALPFAQGLAGDMKVAGLPTGTVGIAPQTEQFFTAPLSFPGRPEAGSAAAGSGLPRQESGEGKKKTGTDEEGQQDTGTDTNAPPGGDTGELDRPGGPFGPVDDFGPKVATQQRAGVGGEQFQQTLEQDRERALDQVALAIQKLMQAKPQRVV